MSSLRNRDYRMFEKSLVSFLDTTEEDSVVKNITAISDTVEQIQDLINAKKYLKEFVKSNICTEELQVSNNYYHTFCARIDNILTKTDLLKYIYNIYLCGRGLSTARLK